MKSPFSNSDKNSDKVVDIGGTLPSRRSRKKSFVEKLFSPLEGLKSVLSEISFKYVASIIGGVFFCIAVVGAVLIFVDPSSIKSENKLKPSQVEDSAKSVYIKISEGMTTGEIADTNFRFTILLNASCRPNRSLNNSPTICTMQTPGVMGLPGKWAW